MLIMNHHSFLYIMYNKNMLSSLRQTGQHILVLKSNLY